MLARSHSRRAPGQAPTDCATRLCNFYKVAEARGRILPFIVRPLTRLERADLRRHA